MTVRPTIRDRLRERVCPNCGATPERKSPKGPPPTFCTTKECKREMNNRLIVEGRAVIGLLKGWRIDRGSGEIAQKAFSQVCEIVDLFNAEDLEAGRPRADLYAATLLADGTKFYDRRRPSRKKETESA